MVSTVGIALKATGIGEVNTALKSVKSSLLDIGKATTAQANIFKNASKEKISALKAEENAIKAVSAATREAIRLEQELTRASGRGISGGSKGVSDSIRAFGLFGHGVMGAARASYLGSQNSSFGGGIAGGAAGGAAGLAFNLALQALSSAVDIATTSVKMFGNFLINDIVKPELSLQTKYGQLSAKSAEINGRGLSAADAEKSSVRNFIKYGISKEDNIEALNAYGAYGGEGAWSTSPKVAELAAKEALVRGGKPADFAKVIGGMRVVGESVDDTITKYLATRRQGDIGSIPVEDLKNRGKLIKAASLHLGGNNAEAYAKAFVAINKSSEWASHPETAITGFDRFAQDVLSGKAHAKYKGFIKTNANGEKVIDDPGALIGKILADAQGDPSKLKRLGFADVRARRFLESSGPEFSKFKKEAEGEGLTGKAAWQRAAVLFGDSISKATKETDTLASIDAEVAIRLKDSGVALELSFNEVKQMLTDDFMPVVKQVLADLQPVFDDFADWLEENSDDINTSLEKLGKSFILGVDLMSAGIRGMMIVLDIVSKIPGALSLIPGIGPLLEANKSFKEQTGKDLIDTLYDARKDDLNGGGGTGNFKDAGSNPRKHFIPRSERKEGIVTVGELYIGDPANKPGQQKDPEQVGAPNEAKVDASLSLIEALKANTAATKENTSKQGGTINRVNPPGH